MNVRASLAIAARPTASVPPLITNEASGEGAFGCTTLLRSAKQTSSAAIRHS